MAAAFKDCVGRIAKVYQHGDDAVLEPVRNAVSVVDPFDRGDLGEEDLAALDDERSELSSLSDAISLQTSEGEGSDAGSV